MDVRIEDGDIAELSSGRYELIGGIEEAVQRVRIAAMTVKGGFIYDRELGTDYRGQSVSELSNAGKLDMLIKESCADIGGAEVEVVSFDTDSLKAVLRVTFRNRKMTTEVDLSGILQRDT